MCALRLGWKIAVYHDKMEEYTKLSSDMNELGEIVSKVKDIR